MSVSTASLVPGHAQTPIPTYTTTKPRFCELVSDDLETVNHLGPGSQLIDPRKHEPYQLITSLLSFALTVSCQASQPTSQAKEGPCTGGSVGEPCQDGSFSW